MNNRKVINNSCYNSYLHFLCWLKESLRQASKKELVHFFEREQTSPKVTEAKERALCGSGKKSFPSRRPAGGTTHSASLCIVLSPQPCYGRRIFSFTPHVAFTSLQPTIANSNIFYYHTNHLGSTAFVTDQNQNVTQGFLYAPFGEITTEYDINFGYNVLPKYSFNAKELDEETGMYYYEARYYKPPVFTSRDPMFEKYFWMTPYAYCANNPVKYVDPNGCVPILPDPIKKSISKAITTSAEYAHALYNSAASIVQSHPQWIPMVNRSLSSIKKGVEKVTDMNPKTMGWLDLTNIWLFELGNTSEYTFGPDANTTKQLMNQEGVSQARETAYNNIKKGKFDIINHPWRYNPEQFYEGVTEGNAVTSFLGSYTTTVNIIPGKHDGEFILNFEVKNTSSWESATRLRKDNDGNGNNDGIIPSKERGLGIRLGGNLRQTWRWSETISVNN